MRLLRAFLIDEWAEILGRGIRLVTIGDRRRLPPFVHAPLAALEVASAANRGMTLCLALFRLGIRSVSLVPGQLGVSLPGIALALGDREACESRGSALRPVEVTDAWFAEDVPPGPLPAGFADARQKRLSGDERTIAPTPSGDDGRSATVHGGGGRVLRL